MIEDLSTIAVPALVDLLTVHTADAPLVRRQLERAVLQHVLQTYVYELHIASSIGVLQGSTPAERYRSFIAATSDPSFVAYVVDKYEGLRSRCSALVESHVRMEHAVRDAFAGDREALGSELGFAGCDAIAAIALMGDAHDHGMRTARVTCECGESVFFKPRDTQSERTFRRLRGLLDLDERTFAIPAFVDSGRWSWHVDAGSARRIAGAEDYRALGAWLAFAYVTSSYDLHFENLNPGDGGMRVLDLECMFSARRAPEVDDRIFQEGDVVDNLIQVGILPHFIGAADGVAVNLGAVGGEAADRGGHPYFEVTADGSDDLMLRRRFRSRAESETPAETPTTDASRSEASPTSESARSRPGIVPDDARAMRDTFERTLESLAVRGREVRALLDASAPDSRVILRPTQIYGEALMRSAHPAALLTTDRAEEAIAEFLAGSVSARGTDRDDALAFAAAEAAQLHLGRIPSYVVPYDVDAVIVSGAAVTDVQSAQQIIARRLPDGIDAATLLDNFDKVMAGAFATQARSLPAPTPYAPSRESGLVARAVDALHDSVTALADRDGGRTTPLSLLGPMGPRWDARPLGVDLYNGDAGIMLSLALAGTVRGGSRAAVEGLDDRLRRSLTGVDPTLGAYSGTAGVLFARAAARVLGADDGVESIVDDALAMSLAAATGADLAADVISGSAGTVVVMAELARMGIVDHATAHAVCAAGHARLDEIGIDVGDGMTAWRSPSEDDWLGGLSHGCGGIAWAMRRCLETFPRDAKVATLADRAIRAQQSLRLEAGVDRWRDRRAPSRVGEGPFEAWCHGAEGLLLAEVDAGALADERLERIARELIAMPITRSSSLCHGLAGRVSALAGTARVLERRALPASLVRDEVRRLASSLAQLALDSRDIAGHPEVWNESLMLGRAGWLWALSDAYALDEGIEVGVSPLTLRLR